MVFADKECECGNYEPISTKGVIIHDCKNCGGSRQVFVAGPPRRHRNVEKLIKKVMIAQPIRYVLGFIFCAETKQVLLIKKRKPEFQKGYYNGIGGKIEGDESGEQAMTRECKEECGLLIHHDEWAHVCTMVSKNEADGVSKGWEVITYAVSLDQSRFEKFQTMEAELVVRWKLVSIQVDNSILLGNIVWLVGMSVDMLKNHAFAPPVIEYHGISLAYDI